jgi:hypothetical protein
MIEAMEAAREALDPVTPPIEATVAAYRVVRLVPVLVAELAFLRAQAFVAGRKWLVKASGRGGGAEG